MKLVKAQHPNRKPSAKEIKYGKSFYNCHFSRNNAFVLFASLY